MYRNKHALVDITPRSHLVLLDKIVLTLTFSNIRHILSFLYGLLKLLIMILLQQKGCLLTDSWHSREVEA